MTAERIRVLFLVSTLRRGGPTGQLFGIVSHIDRALFDPLVVTLSPEPEGSMRGSFEGIGIRVKSLSLSRARGVVHRRWRGDIERLAGAHLDRRCVVHSHGIRADIISSTGLSGLSRVATARNYPYDDYVMKYGPLLGRWMARRHLRAFRALPLVVACSSTLAGLLRNHGVGATVIRDGVDTALFRPSSPAARARLRVGLGLPGNARVGVCIGSLIARKNPLGIVRAMKSIDDPRLVMIFVGDGILEKEIRAEARDDPRIRLTGHVDGVLGYLQAADFFVLASRSEGMPNAALEALACGLPMVLSDIDPHRELLQLAPAAGELFALQDDLALSAAIRRAAASTKAAAGAISGQAAEMFAVQLVSRRYQDLYLRLVGNAPGFSATAADA